MKQQPKTKPTVGSKISLRAHAYRMQEEDREQKELQHSGFLYQIDADEIRPGDPLGRYQPRSQRAYFGGNMS